MSFPVGRSMKQVERERSGSGENESLLLPKVPGSGRGRSMINTGTMAAGQRKTGSGNVATFFNFVKASIGSGSFALPWGIMQAGILVGAAGMALLGIASVYTMQMMLELKQFIQDKAPPEKRRNLNYTEIGYISLGTFGKWAVNIAVLGCNLGVCAGYMIFISSNLEWVFNCISVSAHNTLCFSSWEVYAMLLPILILLTFLPSFKYLAYAAYVGTVFLVIAMIVVYVYGIQTGIFCAVDGINGALRYVPEDWFGLAQWFGVTAFLFCVHSMVIPLESVMKKPRSMPTILDFAALMVVGVNLPFALYGYLLFGSNTQGYVFANLPANWFNSVVRALLSLELTLTFPIVIKPATDVMEQILKNFLMFLSERFDIYQIQQLYESTQFKYKIGRTVMIFILRALLVLISWGVAVGIPRFELCLALVGSLTTTVLAFILPPLFHLKVMWRVTHLPKKIFHICLLFAGILITILATSINLYMAIIQHSKPTKCEKYQKFCGHDFIDRYEHCSENFD